MEMCISSAQDFPNVAVYFRPGPVYRIAFKNLEFAQGAEKAALGIGALIAIVTLVPMAAAYGIYAHHFGVPWYYGAGVVVGGFLLFLSLLGRPSQKDRAIELDKGKDRLRVLHNGKPVFERPLSSLQNLTIEPHPEAEYRRQLRIERGEKQMSQQERQHCLFGWFGTFGAEKVMLVSRAEWPSNNSLFEVRQAVMWAKEQADSKQIGQPERALNPPLD